MALRSVEFHILLALAGEELHGYAILQEVARLTEGDLQIEPGTLYRALHRMLNDRWIEEAGRRFPEESGAGRRGPREALPGGRGPRSDNDERRRYYRLTPLGRRVATAEANRLARLLTVARAHRLITRA